MPVTQEERRVKAQVARRGGAVRVRTQKLKGGKYRHVYVTRQSGVRGGRTVAGPARSKEG